MNKKLNNLAILCAKNSRSIAYLYFLEKEKILPSTLILIDTKKNYQKIKNKKNKYFQYNLDIKKFAIKNNIQLIRLKDTKVNDDKCFSTIKDLNEKYIIYAANYGDILKPKYFTIKKNFIHIHPGKLPKYIGSTTYYYEILNEQSISFSAIFQNKKIDNGKVIAFKKFNLNGIVKSELDHVYDPYLRSKLLIEVILELKKKKKLTSFPQNKNKRNIYYIIHPLLKHIAILAQKK